MDTSGPRCGNRAGFVYFLATENNQYLKIGCTTNLDKRISCLKIQLPFKVYLFHYLETDDMYWLEKLLHGYYFDWRVNGEWFEIGPTDKDGVLDFLHNYGKYDVWTRQDEIDEYRQTMRRLGREVS